jgi:hypothetical protein
MSLRPQSRFESVHDMGRALLPFASGKRRVMWSDYYERGRPPGDLAAGRAGSGAAARGRAAVADARGGRHGRHRFVQAGAGAADPHAHAPGRVGVPTRARARPASADAAARPSRPSDDTGKEVLAVPVIGTDEYLRTTPALRRGGRRFLAMVGLGLLAAGVYVFWIDPKWRDRCPSRCAPASTGRCPPAGQAVEAAPERTHRCGRRGRAPRRDKARGGRRGDAAGVAPWRPGRARGGRREAG